ncbi:MAG: hypothetical protein ACKO96_24735, partial [Flammeovirgaceae bacterium]
MPANFAGKSACLDMRRVVRGAILSSLGQYNINKRSYLVITTEIKIAVLGLGYVGLPVAVTFSKKFNVIGFDV